MKKAKIINSLGHSNVPLQTFLDVLKKNHIEVIVDVRTIPRSRFCPHYNQNALERALGSENIKYLWRGENLGGRGENVGYEDAIDELVTMAVVGMNVAVMCSEGDYHKCHRYTDLTPSIEKRGLTVSHIEYEKKATKRDKRV